MKSKFFIVSLFLIFSCFSISIDEAMKKVNDLEITKIGENIKPPSPLKQIIYGNKKYWVIEIDYGNSISVLVVVDDNGEIVYGNYAKDIMKIYYLNHYFYKDNKLKEFFNELLDKITEIKTNLENRINYYEAIKKVYGINLDDKKCIYYVNKTNDIIDIITKSINEINYDLNSVSDIKKLNTNINNIFNKIDKFLANFKETIQQCDDYRINLINKYKNDTYYQNVLVQLNNILNLDEYISTINTLNISLYENRKIINQMFEKLDFYVDQYYQIFLERIEESKQGKEKQEKLKKLKELQLLFDYIRKHSSFLKSYDIKKVQKLWEEYNKTYFAVINYNFNNFDEKYKKIKEELEKYKEKIMQEIKKYNKTNVNDQHYYENSPGLNQYLIVGILVLILIGLIYLNKRKKKENKDFEDIDFDIPFKY